jgi:hypothetical protein
LISTTNINDEAPYYVIFTVLPILALSQDPNILLSTLFPASSQCSVLPLSDNSSHEISLCYSALGLYYFAAMNRISLVVRLDVLKIQ